MCHHLINQFFLTPTHRSNKQLFVLIRNEGMQPRHTSAFDCTSRSNTSTQHQAHNITFTADNLAAVKRSIRTDGWEIYRSSVLFRPRHAHKHFTSTSKQYAGAACGGLQALVSLPDSAGGEAAQRGQLTVSGNVWRPTGVRTEVTEVAESVSVVEPPQKMSRSITRASAFWAAKITHPQTHRPTQAKSESEAINPGCKQIYTPPTNTFLKSTVNCSHMVSDTQHGIGATQAETQTNCFLIFNLTPSESFTHAEITHSSVIILLIN